ncbi:hypothetical protein CK501_03595 [Halovibrio salipaludis]|uniref:TIGR02444 family protein n=2 Tax=Halovibrio salipaludis TaxID=2032626 RepID=A0A2A2FC95_9GAMM|nr:hypothetical protein CK501_03595 [Halovibrio salipaludis]
MAAFYRKDPMPRQEPPDNLSLDNPLWQYVLTLWRHDGFAYQCLEAQNQGLAVTPLLVALFCAARRRQAPQTEPEGIHQWRTDVTADLRALRMNLPRGNDTTAPLRDTVKQAELKAEQVELAWWWQRLVDDGSVTQSGLSRTALARHNLGSLLPGLDPATAASLVELWGEIKEANGEPS